MGEAPIREVCAEGQITPKGIDNVKTATALGTIVEMVEKQESGAEGPLTMEEFLRENDRDRFMWVNEIEVSEDAMHATDGNRPELPNHVKLECKGTPSMPFTKLAKRLGVGHNTKVWKCFYDHPHSVYKRPFAVKVLDCIAGPRIPMDKALVEVEIMQSLKHHHVAVYIASYEQSVASQYGGYDAQELGIVMYPPGLCDLAMALNEISSQVHKEPYERLEKRLLDRISHMFGFFACLAQGLSYLHTTDVLIKHKDIKPANIIIDQFEEPIITDFGISKRYAEKGLEVTTGGKIWTAKYASPEAYEPSIKTGLEADVFSLGCVLLEIATVLLGGSLSTLNKYLKLNCYQATAKIQTWINDELPRVSPPPCSGLEEVLSRRSDTSGETARETLLSVLPTIGRMTEKEPRERPEAKNLFKEFKPLYQFTPTKRICNPCKKQQDNPPKKSVTKSPGLADRIETLPDPPLDSEGDHEKESQPSVLRDAFSSCNAGDSTKKDEISITLTSSKNDTVRHQPNGDGEARHDCAPPTEPMSPRSQPSPTRFSLQFRSKRRSTTASLARKKKKERRILIYDLGLSRTPKVTIASTSILRDSNFTRVMIERRSLIVTFEFSADEGDDKGGRRIRESIDLKGQGFKVWARAILGRNRGLYIRGRSMITAAGE